MLRVATRLAEAGKLAPRLDPRRFDLESAELAYEALTDGSARGKNRGGYRVKPVRQLVGLSQDGATSQ